MPNSFRHWHGPIFLFLFLLPAPAAATNPVRLCVSLLRMMTFPEWRALNHAATLIASELQWEATQWENARFDDRRFAERSLKVLVSSLAIATQRLRPHERLAFYIALRDEDSPVGYLAPFLEATLKRLDKLPRANAVIHRLAIDEVERDNSLLE
jgi:hypothetical protein